MGFVQQRLTYNKIRFQLNRPYLILALSLFLTELFIAFQVRDTIVRPYGGDFLVVILIYCTIKSCLITDINFTAIGVLLFAYLVETSQYFHLINKLGLERSSIARNILGTSFAWTDLLMYTLGMLLVWLIETRLRCIDKPV